MITLWLKVKGYLAALGVALAVIAGAFVYGRLDGKSDARAEQEKANAKAVKRAREVEDETNKMGDARVDAELSKWLRDDKR